MIITKTFTFLEDAHGITGWVQSGAPDCYNAGNGRLVAHDVLEHGETPDPSWEDELLALGAFVYIRGQTGYTHQWVEALSVDLERCLEFFAESDREITSKGVEVVPDKYVDNGTLEGIYTAVLKAKQRKGRWEARALGSKEEVPERVVSSIRNWVVAGFIDADRRFGDPYRALDLFKQIEEQADKYYKVADGEGGLWHVMEVSVDTDAHDVKVKYCDPFQEVFMKSEGTL